MGASTATSFADVEVAGVGVGCKDHAASSVCDSIVGVCGDVAEKLLYGGGYLW